MKILAFESSCDETAVAVVEDGRRVLSDVLASQVATHAEFGGVVPELASRYRIMSVPTLMVLKDGKIVEQSLGAKPKHQILAML